MGLYDMPLSVSLLGFGIGTMFLLRTVLTILVKKAIQESLCVLDYVFICVQKCIIIISLKYAKQLNMVNRVKGIGQIQRN